MKLDFVNKSAESLLFLIFPLVFSRESVIFDKKNSVFIFDEVFVRENVRTKSKGLETIVMMGEQVDLDTQITSKIAEISVIESKVAEQTALEKSHYWVRAEVPAFAFLAVLAYPDIIELVHGLLHNLGVIGEDSSFEVASGLRFHADASTCEVCAANIHLVAVEDKHLEMNTRTKHSFQTVIQYWVLVEVLPKVRIWFFRMNKSYLHTTPDELGNESLKQLHDSHAQWLGQEKQTLDNHHRQLEDSWQKHRQRLTDIVKNNKGVWISTKLFYVIGSLSLLSIMAVVMYCAFWVYFNWIT